MTERVVNIEAYNRDKIAEIDRANAARERSVKEEAFRDIEYGIRAVVDSVWARSRPTARWNASTGEWETTDLGRSLGLEE